MQKINLKEKSSQWSRLLHIADCIMVVLVLRGLTFLYGVSWNQKWWFLSLMTFLVCILVFHSFQLYRSWRGVGFWHEFVVILQSWGTVIGMILFAFFLTKKSEYFSRFVILMWFAVVPLLLFALHFIMRKILRNLRSKGYNLKKAVIVGANRLGVALAKQITDIPWAGIRVLGFFDDEPIDECFISYSKPLLGTIRELPYFIKSQDVDYLYIALPFHSEKKIHSILKSCRTLGAQIFLVPDIYSFSLLNAQITSIGNMLALDFNPDLRIKRYFDICFSLMVIIMAFPLGLIIALMIKLEDGGPVFYRHKRIALAGKVFDCLKFRTMHVDADKTLSKILTSDPRAREEWEKTFKLKNDPRITWIGRFLRKTSLDELPQFINVLKGDMSVVGARPVVHKELSNYYKENGGLYCSLKPGVTGPWQVSKRSDTEDYEERIKLDTWYVLNRNFWLDLKIIAKTVACIFKGKGSY